MTPNNSGTSGRIPEPQGCRATLRPEGDTTRAGTSTSRGGDVTGAGPAGTIGGGTVELEPALTILSLGAGVQSTALVLLAVEGVLPKPGCAIFADTGWEPKAVYEHLDRLEKVMVEAGIPLHRVSRGNIHDDVLGEYSGHFGSMPLHVLNQDGTGGRLPQSCTSTYKKEVVKAKVRELLGYVHPKPVPRGVFVEQWIGISTDEIGRLKVSRKEWQDRQTDIFGQLADLDIEEEGDPDGCGPFTCHNGEVA